jgi:PAS domain S-box-containing protein
VTVNEFRAASQEWHRMTKSSKQAENQSKEQSQTMQVDAAEFNAMKKALISAEALNKAILKYNPTELIIVDREGHITGFSDTKMRSSKRVPKLGSVMYRDYGSRHLIDMYAELMQAMAVGEMRIFPELIYGDSYLAVQIAPYPEGAVISCRDITERRLAELALLASEKEKDLILSSVAEVVIYMDRNLIVKWANRATLESSGKTLDAIVGGHCFSIWFDQNQACKKCPMRKVFQTGQVQQHEIRTPNDQYWMSRGYPVRNDNDRVSGIVLVMLNITKRKQAEQEMETIQQQLLHSQKMEAIGTLAGGVAHDFNNLLTAIHGCLDLAMMKIDQESSAYHDLREVHSAAARASDLTRQLLLFSRQHLIQFKTIDLNKTITNLLKMLHRLIGEDISILMALEPKLWNVNADPGTIEQVILNLTVNARDSMPSGGQITIRTDNVHLDESYQDVMKEARAGLFVRLTITDMGTGMTPDVQQRIFEPFFTTKGPGKGTGLGLSVAYGIIKQHQGWIHVYSEPGKGTDVKVYLPASFDEVKKPDLPLQQTGDLRGEGERILVIEDEKCVRDFAMRALKKNGYEVFAVGNGKEAFEIFDQEKGEFDIIFCDVVLPDISGVELVEKLHQMNPKCEILISSGYTDSKSQWSTIREKGYTFLQKPYALLDLLQALRQKGIQN